MPDNAFHQMDRHIQDFIRQELSTHTSPEVISGRLSLEFGISDRVLAPAEGGLLSFRVRTLMPMSFFISSFAFVRISFKLQLMNLLFKPRDFIKQ